MNFLTDIMQVKEREVAQLRRSTSERALIERALSQAPARTFLSPRRAADELLLIAEVKKASPSKGAIKPGADPAQTAVRYDAGLADAISVLTDKQFFSGSVDDFMRVREATEKPLLRKDFLIDEWQVYEARSIGADAILLIAAILDDGRLRALYELAKELGMAALLEVHNQEEAERLKAVGSPRYIGINNRDLHSFRVDLKTTESLLPSVRKLYPEAVVISESGISTPADALRAKAAGADGLLVGEALMRQGFDQVGDVIASLKKAAGGGK